MLDEREELFTITVKLSSGEETLTEEEYFKLIAHLEAVYSELDDIQWDMLTEEQWYRMKEIGADITALENADREPRMKAGGQI